MRAYSGMPCGEFIDAMRDSAIRSNAAPAIIDAIDSLLSVDDLQAELEKTGEELTAMEESRNALESALEDLIKALPEDLLDGLTDLAPDLAIEAGLNASVLKTLNAALLEANQTLERESKAS